MEQIHLLNDHGWAMIVGYSEQCMCKPQTRFHPRSVHKASCIMYGAAGTYNGYTYNRYFSHYREYGIPISSENRNIIAGPRLVSSLALFDARYFSRNTLSSRVASTWCPNCSRYGPTIAAFTEISDDDGGFLCCSSRRLTSSVE